MFKRGFWWSVSLQVNSTLEKEEKMFVSDGVCHLLFCGMFESIQPGADC